MIIIGVTGIMGSGKTFVSGVFKALGAEVIDADGIVHELLRKTDVSREAAETFGEDILDRNGSVDRKKLAEKVFRGPAPGVEKLNRIVHPRVIKEIERRLVSAAGRGVRAVVIDAPLLVETGLYRKADFIIFVRLCPETASGRLAERGKINAEAFRDRMRFQLSAAEKEKYADFIVDNGGSAKETELQVRKIWERIIGGEYEHS